MRKRMSKLASFIKSTREPGRSPTATVSRSSCGSSIQAAT
jgi:hypothetical protein